MGSHLVELGLGDVDVAVAQLHVHPQALHQRQAVLVVPEILGEDRKNTSTQTKKQRNKRANKQTSKQAKRFKRTRAVAAS